MRKAEPFGLVSGAEACLSMLREFKALKLVNVPPRAELADANGPDDGLRLDYITADRLFNEAMSQFGSNVGFRRALVNYLMGELHFGARHLDRIDAKALLTDDGFRDPEADDQQHKRTSRVREHGAVGGARKGAEVSE